MKIKCGNICQLLDTKEALATLGIMESTTFPVKSSGFGNSGPVTHHCVTLSKLHILSEPLFSHLKKKRVNNTDFTSCKFKIK